MGIVRTDDELETIRHRLENSEFLDSRGVLITFDTDRKTVEHVLPPGLEPADQPIVRTYFSDCARSTCGSFTGASVYVRARYVDINGRDMPGWYMLAMMYSTDAAIAYGRQLFGEPKKQGLVSVVRDGDTIDARLFRYGQPVINADIKLTGEVPPSEGGDPASGNEPVFTYKCLPAVNGYGFHADPMLVAMKHEDVVSHVETGDAEITFPDDVPDGLGELPIESIRDARYIERERHIAADKRVLTTVDAKSYEPYFYGSQRAPDYLRLDHRGDDNLGEEPDFHARHGVDGVKIGWHGFK